MKVLKWTGSLEEAKQRFPNAYIAEERTGECRVCHDDRDLRCGVCLDCSEKVGGHPIMDKNGAIVAHFLYEKTDLANHWLVLADAPKGKQ